MIERFNLSPACRRCAQPPEWTGATGAAFLSSSDRQFQIRADAGQLFGPIELWALSTTPDDAALRNRLYEAVGFQEALAAPRQSVSDRLGAEGSRAAALRAPAGRRDGGARHAKRRGRANRRTHRRPRRRSDVAAHASEAGPNMRSLRNERRRVESHARLQGDQDAGSSLLKGGDWPLRARSGRSAIASRTADFQFSVPSRFATPPGRHERTPKKAPVTWPPRTFSKMFRAARYTANGFALRGDGSRFGLRSVVEGVSPKDWRY